MVPGFSVDADLIKITISDQVVFLMRVGSLTEHTAVQRVGSVCPADSLLPQDYINVFDFQAETQSA